MSSFRREWGAITFVITVLVGAIAVAISLVIAGAHAPPSATLEPCPSYTPYVVTPTASATPSTAASASASPTATATPSSPTPSATPFNPALANCPTAPLPPTRAPTPTPSPGTTPTPAPATPTPTQLFTPVPS